MAARTLTATQRQRQARRHMLEMLGEAVRDIEAAAGFAYVAGDEDLAAVLEEVAATLRGAAK